MTLKWCGPLGGLSPSAGGLSIRLHGLPLHRPCHRTQTPQHFFIFTGLSGRYPATRPTTAAPTPRWRRTVIKPVKEAAPSWGNISTPPRLAWSGTPSRGRSYAPRVNNLSGAGEIARARRSTWLDGQFGRLSRGFLEGLAVSNATQTQENSGTSLPKSLK